MGTTTTWQIPWPELTDPPDGSAQMRAIAERVDTCLTQIGKDTGWVDLTSVVTFRPNWIAASGSPVRARKIGRMAFVELHAQRATTTLVSDASGNFTDSDILTINDSRFTPEVIQFPHAVFHAVGGMTVITTASPFVWMVQACTAANYTMPTGGFMHCTTSYTTAT
jgi:hypothetical protein